MLSGIEEPQWCSANVGKLADFSRHSVTEKRAPRSPEKLLLAVQEV
jgi:hypothetical protein